MKEIIPIKKDILFKTTIGLITDINLEPSYTIKDNLVSGNIVLSGSYKMTEASVLEEDFEYSVPFGISINKSINKDTIKIEVDDFKYDINRDVLSVNIDLLFICNEDIKEEVKEEIIEEPVIKEEKIDSEEVENITNNITSTIISNDNKYYTYKVYIVRDNDTYETICSKYNISLDELKEYNDISNIKIGDKIIIPYINE